MPYWRHARPRVKKLKKKWLNTCPRKPSQCAVRVAVCPACVWEDCSWMQPPAPAPAASSSQLTLCGNLQPSAGSWTPLLLLMGIQYLNDWTYLNKLQWREPQTLQHKYSQYLNLPQFHLPVKYRYCRVSCGKMHPEEKEKCPSSNSFYLTNL